ncbi:GPP34 family phosphoprotein [Brachybacterium sp. JHP9]|uniref:GPP34 family phosphoprotein n=1 Tax=Brachybacterium equifaecis TaxID=2910770 RepID=A0ABT0R2M0_9MICO|nr:GPP34 family phosphoprotein [Brachybacterium equifaecis]MCL6424184.1 GPP34 family phosphoprotein [Brachybacterium equifaecis]
MTNRAPLTAEIFLLLTDDRGKSAASDTRTHAIAAAAIADLALRGRIAFSEEKNPRIEILDSAPTGIPELDQALAALAEMPRKRIDAIVQNRRMNLVEATAGPLIDSGAIERKDGLFSASFPERDGALEDALRAHLADIVTGRAQPDERDVVLLQFLRSADIAHAILKDDVPELSRRELDRRITELAAESPAARALGKIGEDLEAVLLTMFVINPSATNAALLMSRS